MLNKQLANIFLEQSNDLIWIIDSNFCLKYANQAYQNVMKQVTGEEKEMDEPIFKEGFGDGYIEKWKAYYERGLNGEQFEIEEHFYNPTTHKVEYSEISFKSIADENGVIVNVACKSRDITTFIKSNAEAEILLDASLDVICSIDAQGNFTKVNAACKDLWGYEKHELIGKAYISFVIEEDIEKTNQVASDIIDGKLITTFENRYKRKDGGIAFNLWSAKWDHKSQIMFCVARDGREKIKKEELLVESENRFKALVQEGADMISIVDASGKYIYTSHTTTAILGITPEEFNGNSVFDFIHPDDIERAAGYMQRISTEKKVIVEPFRLRVGNNEWRWIETVLTNMLDNPAVNGIVANSRDITEEKKLEKLNKQTNNLAKIGTWEYDLIENKLFWSNEVYLLHDLDPDTFVPNVETAIDFYKEEYKSYVTDEITRSLTLGVYLDYEAVIITKSKKEKWVRVIGSPEFIEGKCVKLIGSFQDTTDRREAESRLKSLSDNIPGVVFIYQIHPDGSDEFKYVSKGSEKIWGYSPEEVTENMDLVWNQVKAGGDFEEMKQSISDSIENKSQWYLRYRIVRADGEKRMLQGLGTPEFLSNGTVQYNSVVLDITEGTKNEELLEQTTKIARIGSWEVDVNNNSIFWSDMTYQIHEATENFKPQLSEGINFYREDFRELATEAVNTCIETGTPFDFEAIIVTSKNNEVWVRSIGKAEMVDGKCTRIFGSIQDINEKKIAELRLESLANNIPGTIFQFQLFPDGTSKFLNVSKGVEKLYGINAELIMDNNALVWDLVLAGGDMDKVQASIGESLATLTNWHVIYRVKLPNGKMKWLEGLGTPRRLPDGSTVWDSIILDITDLKETEQLLESASKLARVGSWELVLQDNEEYKMFWSSMTKNIVEIDESFEPTLADGINLHKEPSRTLIAAAVNNAIETGEAFDLELELVTGKENDIWVRCIGDTQLENGKVTRIFGSYQDINTRKLAELNQVKINEEKTSILERIGDAFFALDKDWMVTYWNKRSEEIIGIKREDLVGYNLWEKFPMAKDLEFFKKYDQAFKTQTPVYFEEYFEPFNQWYEASGYPSPEGISVFLEILPIKS